MNSDEIRNQQLQQSSLVPAWNRAAMLENLEDEDLVNAVMEVFMDGAEQQLDTLESLLERGDTAGVQLQAHTIKGTAANVCAEPMRMIACEMEVFARNGDMAAVRALMNGLRQEFEKVKFVMGLM